MIENEIVKFMREHGYKWKINDQLVIPSVTDVKMLLDRFRSALFAEDSTDDATIIMTTGRLIVKRDGNHMDVYIYLGDANEHYNAAKGS